MTLEELIKQAIQVAKLEAHPVGSLYFTDNPENPAITLGGGYGSKLKMCSY